MIDITNLLSDTHRELGSRPTASGQARTLPWSGEAMPPRSTTSGIPAPALTA
jgi:hypothetical protein